MAVEKKYVETPLMKQYYDFKALSVLTKTFYVGDRQVSSYSRARGISTVSFNIIEQ